MIRIFVVVFMSHRSSAYYFLFFVHFVKANGTSIDRRMIIRFQQLTWSSLLIIKPKSSVNRKDCHGKHSTVQLVHSDRVRTKGLGNTLGEDRVMMVIMVVITVRLVKRRFTSRRDSPRHWGGIWKWKKGSRRRR